MLDKWKRKKTGVYNIQKLGETMPLNQMENSENPDLAAIQPCDPEGQTVDQFKSTLAALSAVPSFVQPESRYPANHWRANSSKYLLDWLSTFEDELTANNHEDLVLQLVFNQGSIWNDTNIQPHSNILMHLCKLSENVINRHDLV